MTTHLLTHTDLDGVACAALFSKFHKDAGDIYYCEPYNVDDNATKILAEHPKDVLLISDLCPTKVDDPRLIIFDHHQTATPKTEAKTVFNFKVSATEIMFDHMVEVGEIWERWVDFVKAVTAYDCWLLDSPHRQWGEHLNLMLHFLGRDCFFNRLITRGPHGAVDTEVVEALLRNQEKRISKYLQKDLPLYQDLAGNTFTVVVAFQDISQLASTILKKCPEIEYVAIVTHSTVSLRSRKEATKLINVADIAKILSGGGHATASGYPKLDPFRLVKDEVANEIITLEQLHA